MTLQPDPAERVREICGHVAVFSVLKIEAVSGVVAVIVGQALQSLFLIRWLLQTSRT